MTAAHEVCLAAVWGCTCRQQGNCSRARGGAFSAAWSKGGDASHRKKKEGLESPKLKLAVGLRSSATA